MTFRDFRYSLFRRLCRLLPIKKNRVVFCSYYGRGYSDSPRAIAEALRASKEKAELFWLLKNPEDARTLPPGVRAVPHNSLRRIYALSTAKVWVDNCRKDESFKKPGQRYLQTWHGFALKRIEADAGASLEEGYIRSCKQDAGQTDLMVSGSDFMTGIYEKSFWYEGPVENWGTPRNDIFFRANSGLNRKVRAFFGLEPERKLLLYAPTFRADKSSAEAFSLDAQGALRACQERFGGNWTALIRLHPNVAALAPGLFPYDGENIIDATEYPDMQELLSSVDLLITDYSSSMFDYALSGKPCVQFATDVEDYRKDRNFYFPVDSLPFPLARSNEVLCQILQSLDLDAQKEKWAAFARENGFHEDGNAAQRCADWILAQIRD